MQEYPKLLFRPDGREVTAASKADEDALRAEGCRASGEPPAEPKADEPAAVEPEPDEADVVSHGGRKKK